MKPIIINNNEKLLKYLLSFYDNTALIKTIKKNVNILTSYLDLTNSTDKHLYLYFELIQRDNTIFKNNISIINDNLGLKFIINGTEILTLQNKTIINTNEKEFIFFCRQLNREFYNISSKCLYCFDTDLLDFYNCKNCDALICFNCFKNDYILNGDTLNLHYKKCSICRARKGHSRTTGTKTNEEVRDETINIILKKIKNN